MRLLVVCVCFLCGIALHAVAPDFADTLLRLIGLQP